MVTVLVADDEVKLGRLVEEVMRASGYDTTRVETGTAAIEALSRQAFDIVVTDLMLPGATGLDVLKAARARSQPADVVLMTAFGSTENAVEAMKSGAADYLTKPFSMDELRMRIHRLATHRHQEAANQRLRERLAGRLVWRSQAMQDVMRQVEQVAATDTTVLVLGESGTGKSMVARHLHYSGARANGPLIELHCASLPEPVLERQLFGQETGEGAQDGIFAAADGGTVFLDEIGDVPPQTQVKLLRLLQEQEYLPVGSNTARVANVRLIAATNRDLEAAVRAGDFREDLYYRLNVFGVTLPPLRERRDDIAVLADTFFRERGIPIDKLSEGARRRLATYDWPGNVRELRNVLERANILAGERAVEDVHLGPAAATSAPEDSGRLANLLVEGFNLDL